MPALQDSWEDCQRGKYPPCPSSHSVNSRAVGFWKVRDTCAASKALAQGLALGRWTLLSSMWPEACTCGLG